MITFENSNYKEADRYYRFLTIHLTQIKMESLLLKNIFIKPNHVQILLINWTFRLQRGALTFCFSYDCREKLGEICSFPVNNIFASKALFG